MKVLIIQQKMIGDVLTSSILFEALREKYPNAELHYLVNSHTYPVVENNSFIDRFVFYTPEIEKSKAKFFSFVKSIRKENYNTVIDVYSKFSSNLITLFSGAQTKISKYKWYTSTIYTNTFKESKQPKTNAGLAIENRLQLLKPLIPEEPNVHKPKIYLTDQEIDDAKNYLTENGINLNKRLFMIGVLGSGVSKTYPLEYMAKLLDFIVSETKGQMLFNYIPSQKKNVDDLYNLCNKQTQEHIYLDIFGKSLRAFMGLTTQCDALIGNEGGAINMAKALNIPTFAIFSPWIMKEAWNMFDDGLKHDSVHLKDLKPDLYEQTSLKAMKKDYGNYYDLFTSDLVIDKLKPFLSAI